MKWSIVHKNLIDYILKISPNGLNAYIKISHNGLNDPKNLFLGLTWQRKLTCDPQVVFIT